MRVITARNVHQAFPQALRLLDEEGQRRGSRNGMARVLPSPVATVYREPHERVIFWPERDANPFFHLAESLWMLAGRDDVALPARYAKQILKYSDDGETLYGAYGHRWREYWRVDQVHTIIHRLKKDHNDRRCVLQMWSPTADLDRDGLDVPCNLTATFQCRPTGTLDMVVFCRSNDIVWGAYGANAVHFSMLQEYIAAGAGLPLGTYTQVSVNWHAYEEPFKQSLPIVEKALDRLYAQIAPIPCPYHEHRVRSIPLVRSFNGDPLAGTPGWDARNADLLEDIDDGFAHFNPPDDPFFRVAHHVLYAHEAWRTMGPPARFAEARDRLLAAGPELQDVDWIVAAREWLLRRQRIWEKSQLPEEVSQ